MLSPPRAHVREAPSEEAWPQGSAQSPPSPPSDRDLAPIAEETPPAESRLDRVREFFTLRAAEARATQVSGELRAAVTRSLAFVAQKRRAAETLWLGGSRAEALQHAIEAFEHAARATEDEKIAPADRILIASTRKKIAATNLPELESDVVLAHTSLFHGLIADSERLERSIAPLRRAVADVRTMRRWRAAAATALASSFALMGYLAIHTTPVYRTEVSAAWSPAFAGGNTLDDKVATEWLLPDGAAGWLDLHVHPITAVNHLRLRNVRNGASNDRATKDFHIDALRKGVVVATFRGTFALTDVPEWASFDVHGERVDTFHIAIDSHYRTGGGISEIKVD